MPVLKKISPMGVLWYDSKRVVTTYLRFVVGGDLPRYITP